MSKQVVVAASVTAVGVFAGMILFGITMDYGSDIVEWGMSLFTVAEEVEGG